MLSKECVQKDARIERIVVHCPPELYGHCSCSYRHCTYNMSHKDEWETYSCNVYHARNYNIIISTTNYVPLQF